MSPWPMLGGARSRREEAMEVAGVTRQLYSPDRRRITAGRLVVLDLERRHHHPRPFPDLLVDLDAVLRHPQATDGDRR